MKDENKKPVIDLLLPMMVDILCLDMLLFQSEELFGYKPAPQDYLRYFLWILLRAQSIRFKLILLPEVSLYR